MNSPLDIQNSLERTGQKLNSLASPPIAEAKAHIRIARLTDNLQPLRHFYCEGLGFEVVWEFKDHVGFNGIMLGFESMGYHLEFVQNDAHKIGRAPTEHNVIVFYLPDEMLWKAAISKMIDAGYQPVNPYIPYWDIRGRTFEDNDGYRVVISGAKFDNIPVDKREQRKPPSVATEVNEAVIIGQAL